MICGRKACNQQDCPVFYLRKLGKCAHPGNTLAGKKWYGPCQWWVVLPKMINEVG